MFNCWIALVLTAVFVTCYMYYLTSAFWEWLCRKTYLKWPFWCHVRKMVNNTAAHGTVRSRPRPLGQSTVLLEWQAHDSSNTSRDPSDPPPRGCCKRIRLDESWFGIPEKAENPDHPVFISADITRKARVSKWEFRDSAFIPRLTTRKAAVFLTLS